MFGDLVVNLVARINNFTRPMAQARGMLSSFRAGAASAVSGVTSAFGRLSGIGGIVASALGGLSAGAALKSFADTGSALYDMSARTGASVEALSALSFAAGQTGTDMATVEAGIKKMDSAMFDAVNGNKAAASTFAQLGLDAATLIDLPLDQRMLAVAEAFDKIENPSKKGALAVDLLGKSGRDLIPMLKELGPLQERSAELGLGWSTEDAALADSVGDRLDEVALTLGRMVQIVGSELSPAFLSLTDSIGTWLPATREWVSWLIGAASELYQTLSFTFTNFGDLASLTLSQVGSYFVTLGEDIAHFFSGTLPAVLMGFVTYATTLMSTLLDNIGGKMSDVKAMLTGGKATHTWKPMGDVPFQANAPERKQSWLERGFAESIAEKKARLGNAMLAHEKAALPKPEEVKKKQSGPLFFADEERNPLGLEAWRNNKSKLDGMTDQAIEQKRNKVNSDWEEHSRKGGQAGEMKPTKLSGALAAGSREAYSAIVNAMAASRGGGVQQKQLASAMNTEKHAEKVAQKLDKIEQMARENPIGVVASLE